MKAPELGHGTRQLAEAYAGSNDHAGWVITDLLAFIEEQKQVITLLVRQADASESQALERVRLGSLPPLPESRYLRPEQLRPSRRAPIPRRRAGPASPTGRLTRHEV